MGLYYEVTKIKGPNNKTGIWYNPGHYRQVNQIGIFYSVYRRNLSRRYSVNLYQGSVYKI